MWILWGFLILIGIVGLHFFIKCACCLGVKNKHWPDCSGKVIVITGANTGVGFISACEIAKLNPKKLILACRDPIRGNIAV